MTDPCKLCPNFDWCRRHGCLAWNDHSRWLYDEVKRRSKETNDLIDELERDFPDSPMTSPDKPGADK